MTPRLRVVGLGTSITAGGVAGTPASGRWGAQACTELGYPYWNSGQNSSGYLSTAGGSLTFRQRLELPAWVTAHLPDIVVVEGGTNDTLTLGGFLLADLVTEINQFYDRLDVLLPNAKVIVLSPWPAPDRNPTDIANISAALQALVAARAGTGRYSFIDMTGWITDWATQTSDGIHPNNTGNVLVKNGFVVAMRALGFGVNPFTIPRLVVAA